MKIPNPNPIFFQKTMKDLKETVIPSKGTLKEENTNPKSALEDYTLGELKEKFQKWSKDWWLTKYRYVGECFIKELGLDEKSDEGKREMCRAAQYAAKLQYVWKLYEEPFKSANEPSDKQASQAYTVKLLAPKRLRDMTLGEIEDCAKKYYEQCESTMTKGDRWKYVATRMAEELGWPETVHGLDDIIYMATLGFNMERYLLKE